jgi:hypothetical protein
MRLSSVCVRAILLVALFTGISFAGAVVFSNLVQPGDQYGPDPVGIGHTPGFPNPGDYLIFATNFTPQADYSLTEIDAPLGVVSGPNQIEAYLMADSGGQPGAVLESFHLTGLPNSFPEPLDTILSSTHPMLEAGQQYWFAATGGPNTFANWSLTLFQGDPTSGGASQSVTGGVPGPWTVGGGTRTGALRVIGDAAGVPEPGAAVLTAAGLLLVIRLRSAVRHR